MDPQRGELLPNTRDVFGVGEFSQPAVEQALADRALPLDAPLSVIAVELLPGDHLVQLSRPLSVPPGIAVGGQEPLYFTVDTPDGSGFAKQNLGARLAFAAANVEREMRQLPGLGTITSSAALQKPEIVIRPDPERAADLGVTTETLGLVTRIATSGDVDTGLSKFNLDNRQIPIRVRLTDASRSDLERIKLLAVPGKAGPVPLMNVADVTLGAGPVQLTRIDRSRNISLNVSLNGVALGDALKAVEALPSMQNLPEGVRHMRTGNARWLTEIFSQFGIAMGIGVLSIYAVLVMLFHKFIQPVTILTALPPSAGGALVALLITGNGLAINSLIGLLMLMGIVSKNSILLVEYAIMAQRDQGLSRFDALIDSCSKRARPIVMTTIAMVAGMMPVALGWAGDPSFRAPMGVAVIGGLIVSTIVSLFIVPSMFSVFDDFQQWLARKWNQPAEEDNTGSPQPTGAAL